MKRIVLDTETINKIENTTNDICTQISFLDIDSSLILNDYCKPDDYLDMLVEAMEKTGITPEFLEDKPKVQDTKAWKCLNLLTTNELLVIGHNIAFDIEVIKRTGINVDNIIKIDTLKIARALNDAQGLIWDSCRLSYLKYKLKLYLNRDEIDKRYGITETLSSHNSLNDILDALALYKYFIKEYELTEQEMINISSNPLELIYIPSGKHKGIKISELDYNSLVWYKDNFYCSDTKYSCELELKKRG